MSRARAVNNGDAPIVESAPVCGFLSLPIELRCMIYDLVGSDRNAYARPHIKSYVRLLRTSKQLYRDIVPYLYGNEQVAFSTSRGMRIKDRDAFALSHIRHLRLDLIDHGYGVVSASARDILVSINTHLRRCPALQNLFIDADYVVNKQLYEVLLTLLSLSRYTLSGTQFEVIESNSGFPTGRDFWPDGWLQEDELEGMMHLGSCNQIVQHGALKKITMSLGVRHSGLIPFNGFRLGEWALVRHFDGPFEAHSHRGAKRWYVYYWWKEMRSEDEVRARMPLPLAV